jgi:methylthioribose-1-phosphate isomerase
VRPFRFAEGEDRLLVLDQRRLPGEEQWLDLRDVESVAQAIETLAVRGAPAIGCVAAFGLAVAARSMPGEGERLREAIEAAANRLARTRPTAVNLFVALEEVREAARAAAREHRDVREAVLAAARAHADADLQACLAIGRHGAALMPDRGCVLTHCNAGALATAGYGTALGVIRAAWAAGKRFRVLADETRPVLQGARLTAWELAKDGIDVEVITDAMAATFMRRGDIRAAIVGADRIARNGDVANKIGTYSVAVLCRHHEIPFYVAAPWTTIDLRTADGSAIPIEERDAEEVRRHGGALMTPGGQPVRNPAFDVTPAALVTAIITERGVHDPSSLTA